MNTLLLSIIAIPVLEIYLFIKLGSKIGAFNTILLIFITAIIGVFYARYEGLNAIRSGFTQMVKNQIPVYEIISGATIAFAALLLIIPGFATDLVGFFLLIPFTRNLILKKFSTRIQKKNNLKNDFIEGEFKDIEDDNDRKI